MNRKDLFIFIGPPGAGKGTLSKLCVQNLGYTQLSTGFLCRKHIAEKTTIGNKIDFLIKSGKLIPDSMIIDMVQEWLVEHKDTVRGIILDGFPRTSLQAQALNKLIQEKLPDFCVHVVQLTISPKTVTQRLLNRYICTNKDCQAVYSLMSGSNLAPKALSTCDACSSPLTQREDDMAEIVQKRLQEYKNQEKELLEFYQAHDVAVQPINVEQPLESVFEEFKQHFVHQPYCH
jgi:adenylate kinase